MERWHPTPALTLRHRRGPQGRGLGVGSNLFAAWGRLAFTPRIVVKKSPAPVAEDYADN